MKALALILSIALPAHAATVGMVETTTGKIYLYDDAGLCTGRALRAEFVPESGLGTVGGCWKPGRVDPVVRVVFLDGDIATFPVEAVRAVRAL